MSQHPLAADPAADLRAEVARRQVTIYRLASRVGLHPSHLGQALRGRRPLSPNLVARIKQALDDESGDLAGANSGGGEGDVAAA